MTPRVSIPKSREVQEEIAAVFVSMDTEIVALEARLDKARKVKQGMMHNLLTGKIRLI